MDEINLGRDSGANNWHWACVSIALCTPYTWVGASRAISKSTWKRKKQVATRVTENCQSPLRRTNYHHFISWIVCFTWHGTRVCLIPPTRAKNDIPHYLVVWGKGVHFWTYPNHVCIHGGWQPFFKRTTLPQRSAIACLLHMRHIVTNIMNHQCFFFRWLGVSYVIYCIGLPIQSHSSAGRVDSMHGSITRRRSLSWM